MVLTMRRRPTWDGGFIRGVLANTGLLLRSVQKLNASDPGFRTDDILVGALDLSGMSPTAGDSITSTWRRWNAPRRHGRQSERADATRGSV